MDKKERKLIEYVAPQVIDLGFSQALSGQEETCGPGNTPEAIGCSIGQSNDGSCHTGLTASTTCDQGDTPGGQCKSTGQGAPGNCTRNGNSPGGSCNQGDTRLLL